MIAVPAIDLREGACVQLVGGSYADERVRLPDPVATARQWRDAGFEHLHVVDLDATMGKGSNWTIVQRLLALPDTSVQLGGGLKDELQVAMALDAGADRVVVGTRAIEDLDWASSISGRYPGRVVIAADVRDRTVVTRGWTRDTGIDILGLVQRLSGLPLAGILVTAVHQEGRMSGPDSELIHDVCRSTTHEIVASGGVASIEDLNALAGAGAARAVLGMALYVGALDARIVAKEFRQ